MNPDLTVYAEQAIALKNYAISKGLPVPDATLKVLNDVQHEMDHNSDFEPSSAMGVQIDQSVRQLTLLTYPTTIYSLAYGAETDVKRFKRMLPMISIMAVLTAVASYSLQPNRFTQSLLALTLGLMGSLMIQIFNVMGILHESAFTVEDIYVNYLRMVLGPVMGWVMYITVCKAAFDKLASGQELDSRSVALLFLPFLVGFSTKLVVGILQQVIRSIMIVFGIEDKGTEVMIRQRRDRAVAVPVTSEPTALSPPPG